MPDNLILITTGDPAGVGPEVARAALASGAVDPHFRYEIVGPSASAFAPGLPTPESARAALGALEHASAQLNAGDAVAVVTGPVSKAHLYQIGYEFPGQTEFFAERSATANFAMLLTGGGLTVALVSIHISLRAAIDGLTTAEVIRVGRLLAAYLLLLKPGTARIAVAGLNPHAGEDGALGREEIDIIAPAIATLQSEWSGRGVIFAGPRPPDTVFWEASQGRWDAVLCMYHDQGLIPLKLVGFEDGVNVTLGLPFVRTSPDHGTAFDLAGTGRANPASMLAAIRLAAKLVERRRAP